MKKFIRKRPILFILLAIIALGIAAAGIKPFAGSPPGPPDMRQRAEGGPGAGAPKSPDVRQAAEDGPVPAVKDEPAKPVVRESKAQDEETVSHRRSKADLPVIGTETGHKVVALTFDHSWGNTFTPRILDVLRSNNLKVTFFLMGPWSQTYPETARQIAADGHEIASHGYRHENYGEQSREWIIEDLTKSHNQIKSATGVEPKLFRPPNGHYSKQSLQLTSEFGYKTILWNVDSLDWTNPGRDVIVERVMRRVKPGAIILMHASDTPVQTADALPILLEKLAAQGYRIVTVGELLTQYSDKGILRDGE